MKKILSFFLIICICTVFFASCDDSTSSGSVMTTTVTTSPNGTTSANGTTSNLGTTASASVTVPSGTANTKVTASTTASSGSTTSGNTSEPDIEKGERITEDQWKYLVSDSIKNFSFVQVVTRGDAMQITHMAVDGKEYIQTITVDGKVARKVSQFTIDGITSTYNCDLETGKWTYIGLHVQETYPLYACPYPFAEFDFDESTGTYSYTNIEDEEMDAKRKVEMRFKDGVCIYLKMTMTAGENVAGIVEATIFDHGTTFVPHPNPADITVSSGSQVTNPGTDHNEEH